jgi:predicted regulator of Ras-like GTPase activity (Roadblock/LC7/MglB family)
VKGPQLGIKFGPQHGIYLIDAATTVILMATAQRNDSNGGIYLDVVDVAQNIDGMFW